VIGQIILDTGPLIALLDSSERHHAWAIDQLSSMVSPLMTCQGVLAESCYLLHGMERAVTQIGKYCETGVLRENFDFARNNRRVFELMRKYRNVPMSFTDACLVCMAEETKDSIVFTLNSDFNIYRYRGRRVIPTLSP
jgi:predicted nucleic acid-binding protein